MSKKILWIVVSGLMVLSLVMAACGPAETPTTPTAPTTPTTPTTPAAPVAPTTPTTTTTPTAPVVKPTAETPKYGGTLMICLSADPMALYPYFGMATSGESAAPLDLTTQTLWGGDWAKGAAGGYGTNEEDFNWNYPDNWALKAGYIAESWKWLVDTNKQEGSIICQIRRGIHYALNPNSEASRLANGRELTADDVVFNTTLQTTPPNGILYRRNPELAAANVTKTGPWEVTIKLPLMNLPIALQRLMDTNNPQVPPEVMKKYGDMTVWKNLVGSGPFVLTDYVPASSLTLIRNPNFWMKDPIGPGKGNQLPYLERVMIIILPDISTRMAAFRTGKYDRVPLAYNMEDSANLRKANPEVKEAICTSGATLAEAPYTTYMRVDKVPFNDVRVRRAMMMAINWDTLNQGFYKGQAHISYPFGYVWAKKYQPLYVFFNDPDCPESVKEVFGYHPDKAKQLLKEAGYPNGFKTTLFLPPSNVDGQSVLVDYWAKIGVSVELQVKELVALNAIGNAHTHEAMMSGTGGLGPPSIYYAATSIQGQSATNSSMVNDPVINDTLAKIRLTIVTEENGYAKGMPMMRELVKYIWDQAYQIPVLVGPGTFFWWPWLKNYSGEQSVGYGKVNNWVQWVWIDQELKKSMGH